MSFCTSSNRERVWLKKHPGRCYGALNCFLPWQLQLPVKIKLLNTDGAFVEYRLALAFTIVHGTSCKSDHISNFIQVRKALFAVACQVFSMGNLVSCVHIIAEIATSIILGDGQKEQRIVNRYIDLATCNDVYNWYSENCILHAGRRNARSSFRSVTNPKAIPMHTHSQRTHSNVWSQLAFNARVFVKYRSLTERDKMVKLQ